MEVFAIVDPELLRTIANIATIIGGVALAFIAWRREALAAQLLTVEKKVDVATVGIHEIHVATNSMKEELVDTTKKIGLLEGADIERIRQKAEQAAVDRGKQQTLDVAIPLAKAPEKLIEKIVENKENADDLMKDIKKLQKP